MICGIGRHSDVDLLIMEVSTHSLTDHELGHAPEYCYICYTIIVNKYGNKYLLLQHTYVIIIIRIGYKWQMYIMDEDMSIQYNII